MNSTINIFENLRNITASDLKARIQAGADVNQLGAGLSVTPLMWILREGFQDHAEIIEIMKLLVSSGADIHVKDSKGNTAAMLLIGTSRSENETMEILRILLDAGANLEAANGEGNRISHKTAFAFSGEGIAALFDLGLNFDSENIHGHRPVHIAASNANKAAIDTLKARGVDIFVPTRHGKTLKQLLHSAYKKSRGK